MQKSKVKSQKNKSKLKILALDYGVKNIGLAISDDKPSVALPWQTINVKTSLDEEQDQIFEALEKLVHLERIEQVIIGMPLKSSGEKTKLGDQIFVFSRLLQERLDIPVDVIDERFTSKIAAQLPHQSSRNIHELSAQVMLQEYIDKIQISKIQ